MTATLVADLSMSLDGFVADASDGVERLFPAGRPGHALTDVGALISGRRNFDIAGGWCGHHPSGVPVFVLTHSVPYGWPREDSSITFVTDGLDSAVAQAGQAAGDRVVGVATASVTQQLLNAGQLDRIRVSVVPVLLGEGVPFFDKLQAAPIGLDGPSVVQEGGVIHLTYGVQTRKDRR